MCALSNVFGFDEALMLWSICDFTGIKYTCVKYSLCLALFLARAKSHKAIFTQPLAASLCDATLFSHERGHPPTQRVHQYLWRGLSLREGQLPVPSSASGISPPQTSLLGTGPLPPEPDTRLTRGGRTAAANEAWTRSVCQPTRNRRRLEDRSSPWDVTLTRSRNWLMSVTLPG